MLQKKIKVPATLTRAVAAGTSEVDLEKRTVRLSISSDVPYKRYDYWNDEEYWEILDHGPDGIDDERLKAGLPILFNHSRNQHLGRGIVYENDGHKCSVVAKFSDSEFAQEKLRDVQQKILVDASVGYELVGEGICVGAKEELPVYKFRFKVYEGSLVTVPADISVGVGRQRDQKPEGEPREISIAGIENKLALTKKEDEKSPTAPHEMKITPSVRQHLREADTGGNATSGSAPAVDVNRVKGDAIADFKARCKKIDEWVGALRNEAWRQKCSIVANKHKEGEADFDAFRSEALNLCTTEACIDPPDRNDYQPNRIHVIGERTPPTGQNGHRALSIGAQFVRSKEFQAAATSRDSRHQFGIDIDYPILGIRGKVAMAQRAGFTSTDLSAINVQIQSGVVALGIQRLTIMDLIAPGTTGAAAIIYPRENSMGTVDGVAVAAGAMPRAKTVGERQLKPNWDPDLTTQTATVKQVAITTKVPNQFMADFPAAQSYIDERLPFMVDTETEYQILYGDGLGNNLQGIFSTSGIQTRVITTTDDSTKAASLKQGLTDIQVNSFFEPDGYAFHPYDWETASLLKDTTGRFLAGGPYYIPYTGNVFVEVRTFWGKPVVVSTAVTYGKPVAGAWKLGAQYFIREGMRLEMTNANQDDFLRNMIAIRAEHRLALAVYRPLCFLEFQAFPARA